MTKHLDGETKMDRWCDFDYGYFPAGPLAEFWREHDAHQRAKRTIRNSPELAALIMRRREILKDRTSGNQKPKGERSL